MTSSARASSIYLRLLETAATRARVDFGAALDEVGIDREDARRADAWFPRDAIYRLWERLAELTHDPAFGIHVAEAQVADPSTGGVVEYAARNAPTLADAYARVERYARLVLDGADYRFEWAEDSGVLSYALPDDPRGPPRIPVEWAVALWVVKGRALVGVDFAPVEVSFPHARSVDTAELDRVLRCPLQFGAERTRVVLARRDLERPVVGADRGLSEVLDRYAEDLLAKIPSQTSIHDRVRHYLVRALSSGGDPSLPAIADALHVSARTLQRRLHDEGVSHRDLVDEIRRDFALRFVENAEMSIGEMTFLLGFSEPSAFLRAFRRWTGSTPGKVRAEHTRAALDAH